MHSELLLSRGTIYTVLLSRISSKRGPPFRSILAAASYSSPSFRPRLPTWSSIRCQPVLSPIYVINLILSTALWKQPSSPLSSQHQNHLIVWASKCSVLLLFADCVTETLGGIKLSALFWVLRARNALFRVFPARTILHILDTSNRHYVCTLEELKHV